MTNSVDWVDLFSQVLQQLPITLLIFILSLFFALILGCLLTTIRIKKVIILSPIVRIYLSFILSTPLILQLFLAYFALPQLLLFIQIDINHFSRLFFVILSFTLYTGAYLSDIILSGYQSVDFCQI